MSMLYLIAFFAPCFYALSILIESLLSLNIFKKPATMCFFVSLTNSLFVPLIFLLDFPSIPTIQSIIVYIILALLDIIYLYPYYMALKKNRYIDCFCPVHDRQNFCSYLVLYFIKGCFKTCPIYRIFHNYFCIYSFNVARKIYLSISHK